jgi:hypothetical protein
MAVAQQFHSLKMRCLAETLAVLLGIWSAFRLVFHVRNIHRQPAAVGPPQI